MQISLYPPLSIHEIGQRDNQEDAIWPLQPTSDNKLFILCDGMGGHEHGEVASQTVSHAIGEWFDTEAIEPLTKSQIEEALSYAYTKLDEKDDGEFRKMGTTLTILYLGSSGVFAAHMGDSRIYHMRPELGVLYQSRDHSLVFDLFQAGEISYDEMKNFKQKNIVTRAMTPGEDNRMRPDIIHITDVQPGDYFYLCSDGMLEKMSNEELVSLLSSDKTDGEKREQLITATVNNQDNHSAWIIHVKDVIHENGDEELVNEEPTARCNAINIIPQADTNDDVKIVDDDDVVVVSSPRPAKNKLPVLKITIAVLTLLLVLYLAWFLFLRNSDKEDLTRPKPMMQVPIRRDSAKDVTKDSIVKDTNLFIKYEPGNQQPIDASRRNHPTRHIQNR